MNSRCLLGLVAIWLGCSLAAPSLVRAQPESEGRPEEGPRELLRMLGVDDSYFQMLSDGGAIDESEQEALLRVLYAVRKFRLVDLHHWAERTFDPQRLRDAPEQSRGRVFHLEGRVTRVAVEQPPPEVVARFEMKQYYRCEVRLGPSDIPTVVYAHKVPRAWLGKDLLEARMSGEGVFLKVASAPGEAERLAFVAQRVAWHPENVLGDLEMDFGLFDPVRNKFPISFQERECFYQLLAAAGRAGTQELLRRAGGPSGKSDSVVPLFNEPEKQHGRLVVLTGTARRAILIRLDPRRDADVIERFGFDHYYQMEIFTDDSQGNPLVFCVRQLPEGMPEGPSIYEPVRVAGFFFKSWAYPRTSAEGTASAGMQLAPMLVGREPQRIQPEESQSLTAIVAAGLFLVVLGGAWIGVWVYQRSDERFHRAALAKRYEPETGAGLERLEIEGSGEPDFRGLDK